MNIYTMGFTKKSAKDFFSLIKKNDVEMLIDVRLNNQSQFAGFTKGMDLPFFLKELCNCLYCHEIQFAPTKIILDNYKKQLISWSEYEFEFQKLIIRREVSEIFKKKYGNYKNVLFLCSESTPDYCHRRLLAEYFEKELRCVIKHI